MIFDTVIVNNIFSFIIAGAKYILHTVYVQKIQVIALLCYFVYNSLNATLVTEVILNKTRFTGCEVFVSRRNNLQTVTKNLFSLNWENYNYFLKHLDYSYLEVD